MPKISLRGRENNAPRSRPAPTEIMRDDMTIKGNTEGMTVPMHSDIPFLTYSEAVGENMRDSAMTDVQMSADGTECFLL